VLNSKKILLVTTIILLLISNVVFALVPQSYLFYVNDTANILDASLEDYIVNTNVDLYNKTGAQICVVTVESLEGMSIEEYATALFRQYRDWKQR